jgi:hypothetical protein
MRLFCAQEAEGKPPESRPKSQDHDESKEQEACFAKAKSPFSPADWNLLLRQISPS